MFKSNLCNVLLTTVCLCCVCLDPHREPRGKKCLSVVGYNHSARDVR